MARNYAGRAERGERIPMEHLLHLVHVEPREDGSFQHLV
jgi:hypothetical protein